MKRFLPCPTQDQLIAFNNQDLCAAEVAFIKEHLVDCEACSRTIDSLDGDVLLHELRDLLREPLGQDLCNASQDSRQKTEVAVATDDEKTDYSKGLPKLPGYEFTELLGHGGFGVVYKAKQLSLGKDVAIKIVRRKWCSDPDVRSLFKNEIKVLAKLGKNGSGFVIPLDAIESEGETFLVMEFIEGKSLSKLLRDRKKMAIDEACRYVSQAALILENAHAKGIFHCDLKPSNIMILDSSGEVRIIDLGIAVTSNLSDCASKHALPIGTIDYMAPEQRSLNGTFDARTDVYGLGATLYTLLCGKTPYEQFAGLSQSDRIATIQSVDAPAPRDARPDTPEELNSIIRKMLSREPRDRFSSVAEVAIVLRPFCFATAKNGTVVLNADVSPKKFWSPRTISLASIALVAILAIGIASVILSFVSNPKEVHVTSSFSEIPSDVRITLQKDGKVVSSLDANNGWKTRLPDGAYQLAIENEPGVIKLKRDMLVVNNSEPPVIEIESMQWLMRPRGSTHDSERYNSARRLQAIGTELQVRNKDGTTKHISATDPIDAASTEVIGAVFSKKTTESFWADLAVFQDLERLVLTTHLTPSEYAFVGSFGKLKKLKLSEVGNDDVKLIGGLKQLEEVDLSHSNISDDLSSLWPECLHLESLGLTGNQGITKQTLESLPVSLRSLRIGQTSIVGSDLAFLLRLQVLGELSLSGDQLNEPGVEALLRSSVSTLNIVNKPPGWQYVKVSNWMEHISITNGGDKSPNLDFLRGHQKIRSIQIARSSMNKEELLKLAECPNLTRIYLYLATISAEDIEAASRVLSKKGIEVAVEKG